MTTIPSSRTAADDAQPDTSGRCGRALSTGQPCPDHPAPDPADLTVYEVREGLDDDYDLRAQWGSLDAAKTDAEIRFHERFGTAFDVSWASDEENDPDRHRMLFVHVDGELLESDWHVVAVNIPSTYAGTNTP